MNGQSLIVDPQRCHQQSIYTHVAGTGSSPDNWSMTQAKELKISHTQCRDLTEHKVAGDCAYSTATFTTNTVTSSGENMVTSSNEYITI